MRVKTEELRHAALALLQHLDEGGQREFEIDEDFYWEVPTDQRYAPYEKPKELSMGQLSDDWSEVMQMSSGDREVLGYGLVWLAAVLRRVGEKAIG
jgi:hypothetical protein